MPDVFRTTRRVEFCETDMAGIAHFANFYIYMEQAEHELFRSLGLELINRQPDGAVVSWPRVSATCSFHAPVRFDDVMDVAVAIERIGVKSLTFQFEFQLAGKRIASGRIKTVCCRFTPGEKMESIEILWDHYGDLKRYAEE